MLVSEHIYVI